MYEDVYELCRSTEDIVDLFSINELKEDNDGLKVEWTKLLLSVIEKDYVASMIFPILHQRTNTTYKTQVFDYINKENTS